MLPGVGVVDLELFALDFVLRFPSPASFFFLPPFLPESFSSSSFSSSFSFSSFFSSFSDSLEDSESNILEMALS